MTQEIVNSQLLGRGGSRLGSSRVLVDNVGNSILWRIAALNTVHSAVQWTTHSVLLVFHGGQDSNSQILVGREVHSSGRKCCPQPMTMPWMSSSCISVLYEYLTMPCRCWCWA
jgi:hypothetical protein